MGALVGGVQALAFAPALVDAGHWWPAFAQALAVAALVGLLHAAPRPALAAWTGWAFGSVWLVGGTGWMYVSLHRYGGLPGWLAGLAVLALCMALSGYLALAAGLWARWRSRRWAADALLFGALWLLAEAARALILTGFPWAASGYALVDSPLASLAPWLGVYGMGQVMATLVAAVVLAACLRQQLILASGLFLAAVVAASFAQISFVLPVGRPLEVTLLQSSVPQDEKFVAEHQLANLVWHAQQLSAAHGDLVIAPETAIPMLPSDLPLGYWDGLLEHFQQGHTAALIGVPLGSMEHGYTNSVAGISAATRVRGDDFYRYNKHHLVPFGEFVPWGFHWFVRMMNMPLGDFTRGPRNPPSFDVSGQWIAPNICYEDLFGEELAARFVSGQTPPPTILANVSNLAWFGDHVAMAQHLQIARLRSLEFQRPTIRSTNTGATVVIDHLGHVTASLPFNARGALNAKVQGMSGLTPFARWAGAWGLWPLIGVAAGMVLALRVGRPRPVK